MPPPAPDWRPPLFPTRQRRAARSPPASSTVSFPTSVTGFRLILGRDILLLVQGYGGETVRAWPPWAAPCGGGGAAGRWSHQRSVVHCKNFQACHCHAWRIWLAVPTNDPADNSHFGWPTEHWQGWQPASKSYTAIHPSHTAPWLPSHACEILQPTSLIIHLVFQLHRGFTFPVKC